MAQALRPDFVPAVQQVIAKFAALELHAARAGREVMAALAETAMHSTAQDTATLSDEIRQAVDAILSVMPPYAPPLNVMHRILARVESAHAAGENISALRADLANEAATFTQWSLQAREQIAAYGAELIRDGATVFTFTLSETALRTLKQAAHGKQFRVLVTESRPNQDGLQTARELSASGVAVSVSIDACIGLLMPMADLMMVGAEAIMADGSAVAKVGTYPSALLAKRFGVPVYVIVDTMKFNVSSTFGLALELDPIAHGDILSANAKVTGSLFDSTPAHLIRGVVTERGIIAPAACSALMREMPISQYLCQKLLKGGAVNV